MTTIGFIGSGQIGGTVARLAVDAGYDVVVSNSRAPETLRDLVTTLGPRARAATATEAGRDGDVVVVSIPFRTYRQVPAEPLRGKVVIDTINYYPERDGHVAELDAGQVTASELLQAHLPGAYVVKAFNNIFYKHLAELGRPAGAADRTALPIAGDHAVAKATVAELLDRLGYDSLDAGKLADSRRFGPGTPAYAAYLDPVGTFSALGRPASVADLAKLLSPSM